MLTECDLWETGETSSLISTLFQITPWISKREMATPIRFTSPQCSPIRQTRSRFALCMDGQVRIGPLHWSHAIGRHVLWQRSGLMQLRKRLRIPSLPVRCSRQMVSRRSSIHLVVPSLPGYAFSDGPSTKTEWTNEDIAYVMNELMVGLGLSGYVAHGGDIGSFVSRIMAVRYDACRGKFAIFCLREYLQY